MIAQLRIQDLVRVLEAQGAAPTSPTHLPESWDELLDWCDHHLTGLLVITPTARRSAKNPAFEDVQLTARCLTWLANDYRQTRIDGGADLRDAVVEAGVRNSPCGADAFTFAWQGEKMVADWHIKNGGNTRDPARCLRIYYCWEADSQQVIVADFPAHRRTDAT